ncbi:MAG TPA: four helix bundle protein [Gemmatimonadaceae bacterium]|jgi:four helix bundle protein
MPSTIIRSYRDLIVWQRSMDLIDLVDDIVLGFTPYQRFWLGGQMHRAALSIACNIAEGHGSDYRRVYLRQLSDAKGSCTEVETQTLVTARRRFAPEERTNRSLELCDEIGKMLRALSGKVRVAPQPLTPIP